ncbi:hypothetical protein Tco_1154211 [Tanacetum coccineum]
MEDPNITMEEYIRLEEEKARKRGKVFNWELLSMVRSETLSCEPTVSSLKNDEIDFRISFEESDDEENDNKKVNMPLFPSPEPTISFIDNLDFFKDFKNEFPAIVYNNALTSKSDLLIKPTLSPQHIDEFDLKDETSLFEYDEDEQNVLYFNDLFHFNIIYPDDLKSDKDDVDDKIDIIQSSRDTALPPRDQRHQYLRFEGLQYTDADIIDFEMRLAKIYRREVHRVQVFDFRGLPDLMAKGLRGRMLMEHRDAQRQSMGLHTTEEIESVRFGAYWAESARQILDKGDMRDYWIGISSVGDFLDIAPSYTSIRDPVLEIVRFREEAGGYNIWRSPDAMAGATGATEDAPAVDEGAQADPAPVQAPQPPPPPQVTGRTMLQIVGRLEEEIHRLL